MSTKSPLSDRSGWASGGAISELMAQAIANPDCLSLAAGFVDPATLPVDLVKQAAAEVLAAPDARDLLQYGTPAGAGRLRAAVLELFAMLEGVPTEELAETRGLTAGRVLLTNGSQQFLSLVCQALLNPGDVCLVAGPTYFVMLGTIAGVGGRAVRVETDDDGMTPAGLEAALDHFQTVGELPRVKLLYLVPDFENPSGVVLADRRRSELLDILDRRDPDGRIRVLEDAAYRELGFDGTIGASLWGRDRSDRVIYSGTFSKSFSPGLRIGFGLAPVELMQPLIDRKGNEDFGSAHFNQHLLARVLESDRYEAHVADVRRSYRRKRDALLAGLSEHLGDLPGVSWREPAGGLYVWANLPEGVSTGFDSPLAEAAQRDGVMYVPGELCYAPESVDPASGESRPRPTNHMRLSYGVLDVGLLREAAARLGRAVRSVL
ncbi:PLP-dependent aminotransferase family protein [Alienimonas chondri]|uniref:2-aminoadipate transaminase n=1 Tax=Alienimonas chondri TaxID=2681879 RepID=A0ABX1VAE4_9PLAN|nr:PLP-dependent aminotransferase family protein [Alienimonas chondri]NNJ24411.1 2-aminoadipate transaminase [Alienimonas chondri]